MKIKATKAYGYRCGKHLGKSVQQEKDIDYDIPIALLIYKDYLHLLRKARIGERCEAEGHAAPAAKKKVRRR